MTESLEINLYLVIKITNILETRIKKPPLFFIELHQKENSMIVKKIC